MKRIYKVNVSTNTDEKIDSIIVERDMLYAREIFTDEYIEIIDKNEYTTYCRDMRNKIFISKRQFIDENIPTSKEIEEYINNFDIEKHEFLNKTIEKGYEKK